MTSLVAQIRERPVPSLILASIYFVFIVGIHGVAQDRLIKLFDAIGKNQYQVLMGAIAVTGIVVATRAIFRGPDGEHRGLIRFYWLATLLAVPITYVFLFALSSEAVHFLLYAILAVPVFALLGRTLDTLLWVTILGALDEAHQYWVLNRSWGIHYDFNDVVINLLGAAMGVVIILGIADLRKLGLPKSPRPVWKSPAFLFAAGAVAISFVLYWTGRLALLHDTNPDAWIRLSRIAAHKRFWVHEDWSKPYHVLRPIVGLIWVILITAFYAIIDRRLQPRPGDGAE